MKAFREFTKPFEAPQRSVKIRIYIIFLSSSGIWTGRVKGELRTNFYPCFHGIFFKNFMEEEPCTKFYGVLISFHEVMKLQSFEFGVCDVKTYSLYTLLILQRKNLLQTSMAFSTTFHELTKIRSFE